MHSLCNLSGPLLMSEIHIFRLVQYNVLFFFLDQTEMPLNGFQFTLVNDKLEERDNVKHTCSSADLDHRSKTGCKYSPLVLNVDLKI